MPELPEVETICRNLRQGLPGIAPLPGRIIERGCVLWQRTLAEPAEDVFLDQVQGKTIQDVSRRGKFLQFPMSGGWTLLIHLRMSGDLWLEKQDAPLHRHHRLWLDFEDGWRLSFNDARKFGRVWLTMDPGSILHGLGPEPLDQDFTPAEFYQRLNKTRRALKPLLLDQGFIAGVGNIYADEALHLARLHPLCPADRLSFDQAEHLLIALRSVLREGIQRNGASIDWVYRGGDFQNYFHVYQRNGEPCKMCGSPIQRLVIGQRGTHFCPVCQRRDEETEPKTS